MSKSDTNYGKFSDSLLSIVKGTALYSGDSDEAFREITEAASKTLDLERTSVWMYAEDRSSIICMNLYDRGPNVHTKGTILKKLDYPGYFAALKDDRTIAAHDAHIDPQTCEFSELYLTPLGITSMLDAPIRFAGRTIGVICLEHVGKARKWTSDEITFSGSLADLVSHALEAEKREEAEVALKESEERSRSLIEAQRLSKIGNWRWSIAENKLINCSEEYAALHGVSMEKVYDHLNNHLWEIIHPDDRDRMLAGYRKPGGVHTDFELEHRIIWPDGKIHHMLEIGRVLFDHDGLATEYVGTLQDITERKSLEDELIESEKRFKDIAESSSDWFWETDAEHRFTFLSDRYFEVTGIKPEEAYGKTRLEFAKRLSNPDLEEFWDQHAKDLDLHLPIKLTYATKMIDGKVVYISTSGVPVWDQSGNFSGYRGTGSDVTDEVKAQEKIKANEERLRHIFEVSPVGIGITGIKSTIIHYVNKRSVEIFGYEQDEWREVKSVELWNDKEEFKNLLIDYNYDGKILSREVLMQRKNGSTFWCLLTWQPIQYQDEDSVLWWVYDISEQKEAEATLQLAKQAAEKSAQEVTKMSAQLEGVINNMPDGLMMLDEELNIQITNKQVQTLYDLPDTIAEKPNSFHDVLDYQRQRGDFGNTEKEQDSQIQSILHRMQSTETFVGERTLPNGKRVEIRGNLMPQGQGRILTYSDITEREAAAMQAKLGIAFENIPVAICLCDADDKFVFCNQEYRSFYKFDSKLLVPGTPYEDLLNELIKLEDISDDEKIIKAWFKKRKNRRNTPYVKEIHKLNNGRYVEVSDHILEDGSVIYVGNDITEIKEKQFANEESLLKLKASDERFKTLFNNSPVGVELEDYSGIKKALDRMRDEGIVDFWTYLDENPELVRDLKRTSEFVYVNKKQLEIFNVSTVKEYVEYEQAWTNEDNSNWHSYYVDELSSFEKGLMSISKEVTEYDSGGDTIELIVNALIVPGHEDDWSEVITTHVDITYRKQIEEALEKALQESVDALNLMPIALLVLDKDDQVVNWNDKYQENSPNILFKIGMTFREMLESAPRGRDRYTKAEASQFINSRMDQHINYDGPFEENIIDNVWWQTSEHKTDDGGTIVLHADISDLKERELQLKESQAHFKTILESSPVAVGITRIADGAILYTNPPFAPIFGYTPEEWEITKALNLWENTESRNLWYDIEDRNEYVRIFEKEGHVPPREAALRRKDGSILWAIVSWESINYNGEDGILFWVSDITHQKETEFALSKEKIRAEDATKAKSMFLANMSHEIRTPMNAVIGFSHLALMTELTAQQYDYITKIQSSSHNLLGIINDILDFSKIEAGKLEIEKIPFSLDDVLEYLCDLLRTKTDENEIEILLSCPWDLPRNLIGDPLRLGQVLTNLASNATKFTSRGEITLTVSCIERHANMVNLQFDVKDTGIGMTKGETAKIFQSFTQADSSTTRKYGGSGLGLVISKQLVQLMDGDISVKSTKGVGSTFTFNCSFKIDRDKDDGTSLVRELKNKRVLIVDDSGSSRVVLGNLVQSFGMKAETADSGENALEKMLALQNAKKPYFDLILMDWKMPGMDGLECAGRINDLQNGKALPAIVMVSAYEQTEVMKDVRSNNLEGYLLKPVRPTVLLNTIQKALNIKVVEDTRIHRVPKRDDQALDQILGAAVLLVEDIEANQQIARELLESNGLHVDIANNGLEAIQAVKNKQYDLVFMDIQMPEMDGLTATKEIRNLDLTYFLPIVAMTANAMKEDHEKSLKSGMNGHLDKPISPDELFDVLIEWVKPKFREGVLSPNLNLKKKSDDKLPPELPGIELVSALERVNGNQSLLRKLLCDFHEKNLDTLAVLEKMLLEKSYDDAARMVHTLIGSAGNLGADKLVIYARDLETQLKNKNVDRALSKGFSTEFLAIMAGLAEMSQIAKSIEARPKAGEVKSVDLKKYSDVSADLLEKLDTGDGKSEAVLTKLEAILGEHFRSEQNIIRELVEDYEFEQAIDTINNLTENVRKMK